MTKKSHALETVRTALVAYLKLKEWIENDN